MLQRVRIQGFRMLRDVNVPLKPLTVLIGANDTGKSTFMRALEWFGRDPRWTPDITWRQERGPILVDVEGVAKGAAGEFALRFSANGREFLGRRGDAAVEEPLARALRSSVVIELPRQGPIMLGAAIADATGAPGVAPDGSTSPGLLDHYLRTDRDRYDRIVKEAKTLISGLADIVIGATRPEIREIRFRIEGGLTISANEASSGDRSLLFFLLTVEHPSPPGLLMVEEPETGFHPSRLEQIVDLLRSLTRGARGAPPVQVILSTHSPYLLDCIDLETDQVLVFQRRDGECIAQPINTERFKNALKVFNLGEIWLNEDDAGLVGDQPTEKESGQP